MKKVDIFFIALIGLFTQLPSVAVPGFSFQKVANWEKEQKFFPINTAITTEHAAMYLKPLTKSRTLIYTSVPDYRKKVISWDEIKVIRSDNSEIFDECLYFSPKDYLSEDDEKCYQNTEIDFTNLKNPQLKDIIFNVYAKNGAYVYNDLINAKQKRIGTWHYKIIGAADEYKRVKLAHGPLKIVWYQGVELSYFITPFSIFITAKKFEEDLFVGLVSNWNEDEKLQKIMEKKKQQEELDKARSILYDL